MLIIKYTRRCREIVAGFKNRSIMERTYRLYFRLILKGIAGVSGLLLCHLLRAVYRSVKWTVKGIRTHRTATITAVCVISAGLNIWQLVHYKTERLRVEEKCDSLYTKSLETKTFYDMGYNDGLKYNYNFRTSATTKKQ